MKKPLLVLAVCAITTFIMGWVGHRVFSKSQAAKFQMEQVPAEPVKKIDTPMISPKDTLVAHVADSTVPDSVKAPEEPSASVILASNRHDTLWVDEKEVIIKSPDGSIDVKRKFTSSKTFRDFAVSPVSRLKAPAKMDFTTSKYGKLYKTATRKAIERGAVFAGRFAFAKVSCGEGCFSSTIVDMKNGKVYDGPHASTGYLFKLNSRLLIVNPPQPDGYYIPCEVCEPELYEWTGKGFRKLKK